MKLRNLVCFIYVFGAVSADIGSLMQVDVRTHEGAQKTASGHAEIVKVVKEKISLLEPSSDRLAITSMMHLLDTSPTGPGFTEARNDTPTAADSNQTFWALEQVVTLLKQLLTGAEGAQSDATDTAEDYTTNTLPGCEGLYMEQINATSNLTNDARTAHEDCRGEESTSWDAALGATGKCTLALKVVTEWDTLGESGMFPKHDGGASATGETGATVGNICELPQVCDTHGPDVECTTDLWKTFFSDGVTGFQKLQSDFNHTVVPCVTARDDLTAKTYECVQLQSDFENEFCNWYSAVEQGCNEQNACVQALSSAWDDDVAAWDANNDKQVISAKIITHVICLCENLQQGSYDASVCDDAGTNDTYFEEVFATHYDEHIPPWPTNCSVSTYGAVPYPGDAAFANDSNSGFNQFHGTVTPVSPTTLDCTTVR